MKIQKKFTTETAHIVREASSIRCKNNIHGHSYSWVVTLQGDLDSAGMVIDFKDLKPIKDFIDLFDHATVFWSKEPDAEILTFFQAKFSRVLIMKQNPTAENMARLVFKFATDWLKANHPTIIITQVDVWETATGCGIATSCSDNDILVYTHKDTN